jgi:diaminopimelate decarboxylase
MTLRPHVGYRLGQLCVEDVALDRIAKEAGTPTYVYSRAAITEGFDAYANACRGEDVLICYAVKANSNLAVLQLLNHLGAGFDIVSGGELARVLAAGGDPARVIFSGVGKSVVELDFALRRGIGCFNVESLSELRRLDAVARDAGRIAPVSLRINPDVDARTHPYIATGLKETKFGIPFAGALDAYRQAARYPHLRIVGIDCHIGSQLLDEAPLIEALDVLTGLIDKLAAEHIDITHLDLGGGLGISYQGEATVAAGGFVERVLARIRRWRELRHGARPLRVLFEPGRSIVGDAGLLLARVEYLKPGPDKNYAIIDAAMNDLLRPSLYQAWHDVVPFQQATSGSRLWDLVGPVCESGDWLAKNRELSLSEGDLVAILSAGAYGMTMSSNYNTRPRAAEVIIDGAAIHLVREREPVASLFALEHLLPLTRERATGID